MNLDFFYGRMQAEREYQKTKWGVYFDSRNTANDWIAYIAAHLGKAVTSPWNADTFRTALVKVATLCAAAFEASYGEMPPRHYDK